jgi:predicted metal-dependent hydrolase
MAAARMAVSKITAVHSHGRGLREYLRPDFHPSQKDTDGLAAAYLASVGLS